MSRFKPINDDAANVRNNQTVATKNYPFKDIYACAEGDMVYVNMSSVDNLTAGMTTLRDVALIVDISGSMQAYYKDGSVEMLCRQIVDTLASFDDDGIDLLFFSNGLVHTENVANASEVRRAISNALAAKGAYETTMPTGAFKHFCEQILKKNRAGTVLFLTDGMMDDGGRELVNFYKNYLHTQFVTRDNFYCYSIEFGRNAYGALNVLDGLFEPEQGPEDLFDLDSASNLTNIANVLAQVGGMSAIGSDVLLVASVDNANIDMVNSDLIDNGGMRSINGPINKVMSFRVRSRSTFTLKIEVAGYSPMLVRVTPNGIDADIQIL